MSALNDNLMGSTCEPYQGTNNQSCLVKFTRMMVWICLHSLKCVLFDIFAKNSYFYHTLIHSWILFTKQWSHFSCPTQTYTEVLVLWYSGLMSSSGCLLLRSGGRACPPSRLSKSTTSWVILWTGWLNWLRLERKKTCTNRSDRLNDLVRNTAPPPAAVTKQGMWGAALE